MSKPHRKQSKQSPAAIPCGGALFKNPDNTFIWIQWVDKAGHVSTDWKYFEVGLSDPRYARVRAVFDVLAGGPGGAWSVKLSQEEWDEIYK